jgi:hypothetical protein
MRRRLGHKIARDNAGARVSRHQPGNHIARDAPAERLRPRTDEDLQDRCNGRLLVLYLVAMRRSTY